MAEKLSVLFDLDLLLNDESLRSFVQLKPLQVKWFDLPKGKDIVAVLPTSFGKSLLFQRLLDFLPVKADNNILWNTHLPFSVRLLDHFVASVVFMTDTSYCILRSNFNRVLSSWAVRSCYRKFLEAVLGLQDFPCYLHVASSSLTPL